MLQVLDIVGRVASKLDDPDKTYVTDDYVMGFVQDTVDWLFGKMRLSSSQFDETIVVLPAVQAGTPTLDQFMQTGQPLQAMILPKFIRWRLPGQSNLYWRKANGPLEYARDLSPGGAYLDSWAWSRFSVKLATFVTALDLEVTGDFMFDRLTAPEQQITITQLSNRVFSCKLASEVAKARGNPNWVKQYGDDADDAMDDLLIALSKEAQRKNHRVARINRRGMSVGNTTITR